MLTSPVASVLAWHLAAGTGLSTTSMRVGPALLAQLPWPAGDLSRATAALAEAMSRAAGARSPRRTRSIGAPPTAAGVVAVAIAVAGVISRVLITRR